MNGNYPYLQGLRGYNPNKRHKRVVGLTPGLVALRPMDLRDVAVMTMNLPCYFTNSQ